MFRLWNGWNRWKGFFRNGDVAFFGFFDAAEDCGAGHSKKFSNLADGFALFLKFEDFYYFVIVIRAFTVLDVLGFPAISLYFKFEESAGLADVKDDDVLCIVSVFACADFYLLEIAEVVVFCTAGEGYACIEEVDEFGTSGKVVLGDWFPGSSFGSVGYDDCGEAIFLF